MKISKSGVEAVLPMQKKFIGGQSKTWYSPYNGQRSRNMNSAIRKRYDAFNAWGPGFNTGPSVGQFYEHMIDGQLRLLPEGKMAITDPMMMQKADSPITNADTGAFNAIFGAAAVIQYAQNANTISSLGMTVWPSSGFRASSVASISSGVGIAQSSDRPYTIEPTYVEIPITPKEIAIAGELSDIMVIQGETDDALTFSVNKEVMQSNFMDAWDSDLLVDGNTLAGNNFESIDRVTASAATATNLSWTAADEDLYGIDRTGAAYWDAQSYDASGTDRFLTRPLLDVGLRKAQAYWADPSSTDKSFWLTGYDLMPDWEALEEAKQFITTGRAQFGVNGVSTQEGMDGGVTLMKYKGIPIIQDKNVEEDTKPRIYLLNTDYIGLSFGRPLEFVVSEDYFVVGFNKMGLWHAIGEVRATKPAATMSIRDLK